MLQSSASWPCSATVVYWSEVTKLVVDHRLYILKTYKWSALFRLFSSNITPDITF